MYLHVKVSLNLFNRILEENIEGNSCVLHYVSRDLYLYRCVIFGIKRTCILSFDKTSARIIARCGSDIVGL